MFVDRGNQKSTGWLFVQIGLIPLMCMPLQGKRPAVYSGHYAWTVILAL